MLPSMNLEGDHSMDWLSSISTCEVRGIPQYKVDFTVQRAAAGEQVVVKGVLHQSNVPWAISSPAFRSTSPTPAANRFFWAA